MNAPSGSLIAYATSPGNTASDGSGDNGLYTSALLNNLVEPNITVFEMFQRVRTQVREGSNGNQIPWESTSLEGNFYFNGSGTRITPPIVTTNEGSSLNSSSVENEASLQLVTMDESQGSLVGVLNKGPDQKVLIGKKYYIS